MEANITREQALALLREYNEEPFHIQHALTVEGVLRWYARELGYGADEEFWAGRRSTAARPLSCWKRAAARRS